MKLFFFSATCVPNSDSSFQQPFLPPCAVLILCCVHSFMQVVINLACCCHFLRIHYLSPSANQSANTAWYAPLANCCASIWTVWKFFVVFSKRMTEYVWYTFGQSYVGNIDWYVIKDSPNLAILVYIALNLSVCPFKGIVIRAFVSPFLLA